MDPDSVVIKSWRRRRIVRRDESRNEVRDGGRTG